MFFCVIMRKHLRKKVCFLNFKELNLHVYIISKAKVSFFQKDTSGIGIVSELYD